MKAELRRKVGNRIVDCGSWSGFSVRLVPSEGFFEILEKLFELPPEIFVLRKLFKPGLPRKLQHAYGIVIGLVPKLGIKFTEQSASGRFPCPPEIETQVPQRLERWRQDRRDVVNLKSRHVFVLTVAGSGGPAWGDDRFG